MSNSYFQFKQFTIQQDDCAMKVGTDGVLLGAWCPVEDTYNVLDIGTGTGLIALMTAQRGAKKVDAVELVETAAQQAKENVANSPWSNKIMVFAEDIRHFATQTTESYDIIVCNPPYFIHSLKNPSQDKTLARHADTLPFNELLTAVKKLLKPNGRFCLILPYEESKILLAEAQKQQFFQVHSAVVNTTESSTKKRRVLLTLALELSNDEPTTEEQFIQTSLGEYSDWFKQLTKSFYLNF